MSLAGLPKFDVHLHLKTYAILCRTETLLFDIEMLFVRPSTASGLKCSVVLFKISLNG